MITLTILFLILMFGVIRFGIRLAWGAFKILIGIGLFAFCPTLFVAAILYGYFGYGFFTSLVFGFILVRLFRRIV